MLDEMKDWFRDNKDDFDGKEITFPEPRAKTIEEKSDLMADYLVNISESNELIIFNGKRDYIGPNTCIEIGFALASGKVIHTSHPSELDEIKALEIETWKNRMRPPGGK
jgi:hypothetical protein